MNRWLHLCFFLTTLPSFGAVYQADTNNVWDWKNNTGVEGGIPAVTSIYTNLAALAGAGDDATNIQAALNRCASNQVVYLSTAGIYSLSNYVWMNSGVADGVVLRGQGTNQTIKSYYNGFQFHVRGDVTPTHRTNILALIYKDSTNLWVGTPHEDIAPGKKVTVAYFNDDQSFVWKLSGAESNDNFAMSFVVKGTNGNNVHVDAAPMSLKTNNEVLLPHVWTRVSKPKVRNGFESLNVTNAGGNTSFGGFYFEDAHNGWITNCVVRGGGGTIGGIWFSSSTRMTATGNRILRRIGTDDTDGIEIGGYSQGCLVENNFMDGMWPGIMVGENGSTHGHALLYNYIINPYVPSSTWIAPAIQSHGGHTSMILIEGNVCEGFLHPDGYHVTASHWLAHRNHFKGAIGEAGFVDRRWPMNLTHYSWTNVITGNILGLPGITWTYYERTNNAFAYEDEVIWVLGFPATGNQGYTGARPSESITNRICLDWLVYSNNTRHANFDFHTNGWVYISGAETSLTNSYYYDSKPTYFGSLTWPPNGNDVSPITNRIPAMALADGDFSFLDPPPPNTPRPGGLRGLRGFSWLKHLLPPVVAVWLRGKN